jgi:hypothetical protein
LEHKNAGSVTDLDLYNGFVWVEKDGRAASMYYGKKILWNVVTGIEEASGWHIYKQVNYAMWAATYTDEELAGAGIDCVKILVQPDGAGSCFLINAVCHNTKHPIIDKLRKHYERTRYYASKNSNG